VTGHSVWNAMPLLCRHLRARGELLLRDQAVVELGAGALAALPFLPPVRLALQLLLRVCPR